MIKRLIDIVFSLTGILLLFPFYILFGLLILISSGFPVFYTQRRVGKNEKEFTLYKFRTMQAGSDKQGLLTIGKKDARITGIGYFLRRYKMDELPQLINVLIGDMSLVGPRPEVKKYVALYNTEQRKVFSAKPGISDYASIEFVNENEILSKSDNPEQLYINEVMPAKLRLNLKYIQEQSTMIDLKIILKTIWKVIN